jgi:hypothetical protein
MKPISEMAIEIDVERWFAIVDAFFGRQGPEVQILSPRPLLARIQQPYVFPIYYFPHTLPHKLSLFSIKTS